MERRMAERKAFDHSIKFNLSAASSKSGEKTHTAQAQDICADGLRILTDFALKKGTVVRLGLPVNGPKIVLPVFAEVIWAVSANKRCKAGLRFLR
jgi:hypothetical protein